MVSRPLRGACDESRLRSFLEDDLPEPESVQLAAHLDHCAACRRMLERLAAGSRLWGELRQLAPAPGPVPAAAGGETGPPGTSPAAGPPAEGDVPLDFLAPSGTAGALGRLGPYEVTGVLGRGGFGVVLKAQDPALNRTVAIKVLAPPFAASAAARARFAREARAAAAVVHENVIAIHAVDSWNGLPYLVMPCVAGRSLQERVDADGPLGVKEVLRIGMQVALGLAAAHGQGLVHRDVKPSNTLLENGVERVQLSDFGLARAADDASLTQSGVVAGTPQYMSPEQARGEAVDHRSDLFGLGSVLYFMCAGHPPFRANSTPAVLRRVSDERPRPLREVNADVPGWLAEVVERLHAKDPGGRYASATEVAEVLKHHLAQLQRTGTSASPRPIPPSPLLTRLRKKRTAVTLLTATVLCTVGLSGMLYRLLPPGSGAGGEGKSHALNTDDESAAPPVIGSGRSAQKSWDIAEFTAVKVGSAFRVEIIRGDGFKVTTSCDDNVIEHLRVFKEGKTLKIGLKPGRRYRLKEPLKADVTLPALDGLDVRDASWAMLKGFRSGGDFKLELSDASTVEGVLAVGAADFRIHDASTLALKGSANTARLVVHDASDVKLEGFLLKQCTILLAEASTARLAVRSDRPFRATLSDASSLRGSVEAGDLELKLTDGSHATLRGSAKKARVTADKSSHVDLSNLTLDAGK
jgi:serine/threonine-protein kinase